MKEVGGSNDVKLLVLKLTKYWLRKKIKGQMQVLLPLVFTSLASGAQRKASVQSEFNETLLLGKFRYSIRALAISTMQPRFNDTLHLFCNVSTYLLSSSK